MKVKDVMHAGISWVGPEKKLGEIAEIMKSQDIGAVPVGEDDRLIGMVTDRDIACRGFVNGRDPAGLTARDVMSQGVIYCTENEDVDDAVRLMETRQVRRLPVINEKKRMVGMLSLGDISHTLPRDISGEVIKSVSAHHD